MISARPDALAGFGAAAHLGSARLWRDVDDLAADLGALRASDGWEEFLADVPPLDIDVAVVRGVLRDLGEWTRSVADAFEFVDASGADALAAPGADQAISDWAGPVPTVRDGGLVREGDRWILTGSAHGDHLRLVPGDDGSYTAQVGTQDLLTGEITYREYHLTAAMAAALTIRTGDGNDVVEVPAGSELHLTVWTGAGNDLVGDGAASPWVAVGGGGDERIFLGDGDDVAFGGAGNDTILGGAGHDVLDGQDGNDVLVGGYGHDVMTGGRGNDALRGGAGNDHLEGGSGDDTLAGSTGSDSLSGGQGDDTLAGQLGDDVLIGGAGRDHADGGDGRDRVTRETHDVTAVGEEVMVVEVTGSPGSTAIELVQPAWMTDAQFAAWEERINSDLELLRSTETGRSGLEALDAASAASDDEHDPRDEDRVIRIIPYGDEDGPLGRGPDDVPYGVGDWLAGRTHPQPSQLASGDGGDPTLTYGTSTPSLYGEPVPPVSTLFHELAHGFDALHGGIEGTFTERLVDAEGNPLTGEQPAVRPDGSPGRTPAEQDIGLGEWNATGFDGDGDGDIDGYATADGTEHPTDFNENTFREELGVDDRESYGRPPSDPGTRVVQDAPDP